MTTRLKRNSVGIVFGMAMAASSITGAAEQGREPTEAEVAVINTLKQKYPATKFQSVTESKIPGVFEVVMGKNIAYVEPSGRYWLFGRLFDMTTQTDLTEEKIPGNRSPLEWSKLPFDDAIVQVRGTGKYKVAVFSDPDCPYCKRLEQTLEGISDATIYTFLMPLEQLHPQARAKAEAVWCAADRSEAWRKLMLQNQPSPATKCANPIEKIVTMAAGAGITGTPTMIFPDGSMLPGAVPAEKIRQSMRKAQGEQ